MKRNVCWLSTLRQPAHTLFLLLLVGLISFAFISRAVEYLVVNRETDRLAGYYRAIGSLERMETDSYDVSEGVALVPKSKYVAFDDYRRFCSGVLQGIYNADLDGFMSDHAYDSHRVDRSLPAYPPRGLYISDVLVYGELLSKAYVPQIATRPDEYHLVLQVDQVVAGYPEYVQENSRIRVRWLVDDPKEMAAIYDSLQVGKRYFLRAYYNPTFNKTIGRKIRWENASEHLALRPLNESGLWFLPVQQGEAVDFSDPALAELEKLQRVTEENRHTMRVFGTRDMSAIPHMQEAAREYYLAEGRWLDRQDDINGSRVCVVHRDFADIRGLAVGDTITLKLRDLKAPHLCYIVPGEDWGAWQDYETHTEEFEIVCIYGRFPTRSVYSINDINCIYVPNSCMPPQYGDSTKGGTTAYSFILRSPEDGDAFLSENREALAELGLRATLVDTGWEKFYAAVVPMRQAAATGTVIFTLVLVLAMALVAFLYLRQRQRDFAILRSLGVPERIAIRQTLQPIAGSAGAAFYWAGLPAGPMLW